MEFRFIFQGMVQHFPNRKFQPEKCSGISKSYKSISDNDCQYEKVLHKNDGFPKMTFNFRKTQDISTIKNT